MSISKLNPGDEPYKWICKLFTTWDDGGNKTCGTGFLVNVPDSKKHFIMTAGHNLARYSKKLGANGEISSAVEIEAVFSWGNPNAKPLKTSAARGEHFVSDSYKQKPHDSNSVNDYGLIAVDENNAAIPRGGFAFTLLPTKTDLLNIKQVMINGYPIEQPGEDGRIMGSRGTMMGVTVDQLFYSNATRQGVSGGPVWADMDGDCTVIGIHNYGGNPTKTNSSEKHSKATRLTTKVLYTMLVWIKYPRLNVALESMVKIDKTLQPTGVFLKAASGTLATPQRSDFKFPALGRRGHNEFTKLDIIPVKAPPYEDQDGQKASYSGYQIKHLYVVRSVFRHNLGSGDYFNVHERQKEKDTELAKASFVNGPTNDRNFNHQLLFAIETLGKNKEVFKISQPRENLLLRIRSKSIKEANANEWKCGCLVPETDAVDFVSALGSDGSTDTRFMIVRHPDATA